MRMILGFALGLLVMGTFARAHTQDEIEFLCNPPKPVPIADCLTEPCRNT